MSNDTQGTQDRNRTGLAARRGAEALAAAAVIAAGTQAYGVPVRWDNDTNFDWENGSYLDIRLPSFIQPDVPSAGSFQLEQVYQEMTYTYGYPYYYPNPGWAWQKLVGAEPGNQIADYWGYTQGFNSGEVIDGSLDWVNPSTIVYDWIYYQHYVYYSIPEGVQTYVGVRFNDFDGTHYGWIAVERTSWYGLDLEVHAWGYETEAGVPVQAGAVPEPGTLALLAFGALAGTRRRR
jgi:hypothetical protein